MKKRILGLAVIIGVILALSASAFAATTNNPKLTTSKLADATAGTAYAQNIVATVTSGEPLTISLDLSNKADLDKYGIDTSTTANIKVTAEGNATSVTLPLKSAENGPFEATKSGVKVKIVATTKSGGKTTKDYLLKIKGTAPSFVSTDADISKSVAKTNGVAVVDSALDTATVSVKGTLPIKMTAKAVDGLTFSQTTGSTDKEAKEAKGLPTSEAKLTISGTPKKAGKISVAIDAENGEKKTSKTYTFTVLDKPSITMKKLNDATYGKAYTMKLAAKGGDKNYPLTWEATGLPTGLYLSGDQILGTVSGDTLDGVTATDKQKTFSVKLTAKSYANASVTDTADLNLNVKLDKPVFLSSDSKSNAYKDTITLSVDKTVKWSAEAKVNANTTEVTGGALTKNDGIVVYVKSPIVAVTVTSKDLEGLTTTVGKTAKGLTKITIDGTPKNAGKGAITIKAQNGTGPSTFKINYVVDAAAPTITVVKGGTLPTGTGTSSKTIGDSFDHVLRATPGPIKWKAEKLPNGVKGKASGDTDYVITGEFKKEQAATVYTITAENSATKQKISVSGDLAIFGVPEIKTKKLATATTGKSYSANIDVKGTGATFTAATVKDIKTGGDAFGKKLEMKDTIAGKEQTIGYLQVVSDSRGKYKVSADFSMLPAKGGITVHLEAKNPASSKAVSVDLSLDVKGVAPKFVTKTIPADTFKSGTENTTGASIDISGTKPITYKAYIASKDVKKFGLGTTETMISFTDKTAETATGLKLTSADTTNGIMITFTRSNAALSVKDLPINVEVTNPAANNKWVKSAIKVTVVGKGVNLVDSVTQKNASQDITLDVVVGSAITERTFKASGDKPYVMTSKPASTDTRGTNGIFVKWSSGGLTMYGTPLKDSKTNLTFTITNPTTKAKQEVKVNLVPSLKPTIKSGDNKKITVANVAISQDVQYDGKKKISLKPTLKSGTKTNLKWKIVGGSIGSRKDKDLTSKDLKKILNLDFNESTGEISGIPSITTSKDKAFTYAIINVSASNKGGSSGTALIYLGVKGSKFTIDTKNTNSTLRNVTTNNANVGQIVTSLNSDKASKDIVFTLDGDAPTGVTLDTNGKITVAEGTAAYKSKNLKFIANNLGTIVKGSVKVAVNDAAPKLNYKSATVNIKPSSDDAVKQTLNVEASNVTGETTIDWSVVTKPKDSKIRLEVKKDTSDKSGKKATVTVTVPKKYTGTVTNEALKISAKNKLTNESTSMDITLSVGSSLTTGTTTTSQNSALPENVSALPEDEELTDEAKDPTEPTESEEATDEETEPVEAAEGVTLGAPRMEASLTAGQRAAIEQEGYIIAAVLPEMSVTESGQYDIEVNLYENTPEGAKLVWFAFPKDVEPSEDDEIAEFFDEERAEIEGVPASRKIVVSPWLEAEVTYAPVIVVKAKDADGAKDSLEGAEAGDVVTEEALAATE